jgi:hypothetical protein
MNRIRSSILALHKAFSVYARVQRSYVPPPKCPWMRTSANYQLSIRKKTLENFSHMKLFKAIMKSHESNSHMFVSITQPHIQFMYSIGYTVLRN